MVKPIEIKSANGQLYSTALGGKDPKTEEIRIVVAEIGGKETIVLHSADGTYQILGEKNKHFQPLYNCLDQIVHIVDKRNWTTVPNNLSEKDFSEKTIAILHSNHSKLKSFCTSSTKPLSALFHLAKNHPIAITASLISGVVAYYLTIQSESASLLCSEAVRLGLKNPITQMYKGSLIFQKVPNENNWGLCNKV